MAVLHLHHRPRELGRIRMGARGTRGEPTRLEAFRLTSADQALLTAAAARYGGQVRPWAAQPGQFELFTAAKELPCMVAPVQVSQWYELWSAGGCQRRCDGATVTLATGDAMDTRDCQCDPEKRECALTTRLSVFLYELPGLGVWRLESHGYYAATELPAIAEGLVALAQRGVFPRVVLAIEPRTVKRGGKTKRFPVPVLRATGDTPIGVLLTGEAVAAPAPRLAGGGPALPPGETL